ncbi:GIY-YIG nuclease family protein [Paenibacillus sp. UNC499MF]|uniref:GIY-YIG nuclease family protein n=1 Tax=Paenibacillus sp. UNC499MF TaxID=1502751 RepID=UPI0008A05619|nr:GIY-YIG nuclease family protein [Paenibacillus sp. UNC499MF]SEG25321.1 excinuclease ABC subunit C [Paenibacillus sp. UNC499MF]
MNLAEKVKNLPLTPGVYLMKDRLGHIIYVGKAKSLKKRVQTYFQHSKAHSPKVKRLISNIRDFEIRLTDTEFEAFMLECRLIKQLKPLYNKKMKNPLAYTYLVIRSSREGLRRIDITNDPAGQEGDLFFGPYTSRSTVEKAVQGLRESYRILCSSPHAKHSPCLNHSLGLCIGMCTGREDAVRAYNAILDKIISSLSGKPPVVLQDLERRMMEAAENHHFEAAAKYRDLMKTVGSLIRGEKVIGFAEEDRNIVILEPINEREAKLILVKGNRIVRDAKVAAPCGDRNGPAAPHALRMGIRSAILAAFRPEEPVSPRPKISRHDIDEAQILYSFLQGSARSYLIVPGRWLVPGHEDELGEAVEELIAGYVRAQKSAGDQEGPDA